MPANPLLEFSLRLEHHPTRTSPLRRHRSDRPPNRLLSWAFLPYSTSGIEGPPHAGFACPLRSALRVWLPSRRFPPFEPAPALFRAGSAPGIPPSKRSPLERYPDVSARMDPPTVSPTVAPATRTSRPGRPRFLGFDPPVSPWQDPALLAHDLLDAPLGFALLGFASEDLAGDSAPAPLMHLTKHPTSYRARASEYRSASA
jgi:hypothetical protein